MDTKTRYWLSMMLALALAGCGGSTGAGAHAPPTDDAAARATPAAHPIACGDHVTARGGLVLVAPSGGEDTAALQCALDRAAGRTIRLAPGTFHVAQLVADHFVGQLVGAGEARTVVTNVERPLAVTPSGYNLALPGPANPWPTLVTFVGGWFRVADLTFSLTGATPATPWTGGGGYGGVEEATFFMGVVGLTGDTTVAAFDRVTVRGEPIPVNDYGYDVNALNGIDAQQVGGADSAPIALWLAVRDSTFATVASGVPVGNVRHGDVSISRSRFDTLVGGEVFDLSDTRYRFVDNDVQAAWAGFAQYDACLGPSAACGLDDTRLLIAGNRFRGGGVGLDGTFGEDVACRVVGNAFDAIEGLYHPGLELFLGPGTHDCLATGISAFEDLGTDNRVMP